MLIIYFMITKKKFFRTIQHIKNNEIYIMKIKKWHSNSIENLKINGPIENVKFYFINKLLMNFYS